MKVSHPRRILSTVAALACSLNLTLTAQADGDFRTVALTGDQAPGAEPGVVLRWSAPPSVSLTAAIINAAGQTAFRANLSGPGITAMNNSGIYSEGNGMLAEVARKGNQAPGAQSGVVFDSLTYGLVLNAAGQTAFLASLSGSSVDTTNNTAIYREEGGTLTEVARTGSQTPDSDSGVVFNYLFSPRLNAAGQTAFSGGIIGPGVNSLNDGGIYSDVGGSLAEVIREGDQVPGAGSGVVFKFLGSPALNAVGQIAFSGTLTGTGVDETNNTGVYIEQGGILAEVIRSGNQVPGADTGIVFDSFSGFRFNSTWQSAFLATLTGPGVDATNDIGIYSEGSGTLAEVARKGNQAPGAQSGVVFDSFTYGLVLNAAGQTAFLGNLTGTGVDGTNNAGIYIERSGILTEVAREGNQIPGSDPGVVFDRLRSPPSLNIAGQTAFVASYTGPGVRGSGIFATDLDGLLVEIVHSGEIIDVNDDPLIEDLRTLSVFALITGTTSEDGHRSSFNDRGQLVFSAHFTDGSEGIFVSNRVAIPEPATTALLALCLPTLLPRRNH